MPAFKRFGPDDQVDNVLILEPAYSLASGNAGWHGSPEGSASLSLYGGARRSAAHVVTDVSYQSIFPGSSQIPKPRVGLPTTASVNFVWMTNETLSFTQRSSTRWGHEHWSTVQRLYQDYLYRDPDFVTASYDYYCLYFNRASANILNVFDRCLGSDGSSVAGYAMPSGSFTLEAWFKPFPVDQASVSLTDTFTLQSHANGFQFGLRADNGRLFFTAYSGSSATTMMQVTSSVSPSAGNWHHAAVTWNATTLSGTLWLDLTNVGSFTMPGPIVQPTNYTGSLTVGSVWGGTVTTIGVLHPTKYEDSSGTPQGALGTSFHGFIGETRVWSSARTWAQLSSSYNSQLTGTALLPPLISYVPLRAGPLSFASPSIDSTGLITSYTGGGVMGSGALDYAASYRGQNPNYGVLYSFTDRPGPVWHPSDNTLFYPSKSLAPSLISGSGWSPTRSADVNRMLVIDVPQAFYGRQIVPGTVRLRDRTYDSGSFGLVRTLIDDGRGNLCLSGSATSGTVATPYVGYPTTPSEMAAAVGYGTWSDAWTMDMTNGNLVSIFPNRTSLQFAGGIAIYGNPGPLNPGGGVLGGPDRTLRFGTQVNSYFQVQPANGNTVYNLAPTDDLIIAWVVRNNQAPAAYNGLINKHDPISTGSWWSVIYGSDTTVSFQISASAGGQQSEFNSLPYGSWHAGMAALDRSVNQIRIGVRGLDGSFQILATPTTIPADALQNGSGMTIGALLGALDGLSNSDIATIYIGKGPAAATGSVANMGTALTNFVNYLNRQYVPNTASVGWNKVGNVFYGEGLVVIKDPSLLDFGQIHPDAVSETSHPNDLLQVSFRGQSRVPVKTLMCRVDRGDVNASSNPTFWRAQDDGNHVRRHPSGSLYVTTVGVYNSQRELVGVARLADPVRVRARDRLNIKLRMDF